MRLVCPNCGAQYEVDDRVIPDNGRDVQCSSCGHGWYQMPAHVEAADKAVARDVDEAPDLDDEAIDETFDEAEEAVEDGGPEPDSVPESHDDEDVEDDEDGAAPEMPSAPRRPLDDDLRSILQEEAEREMEARATERGHETEAIEIQPELGLDEAPGEDAARLRAERDNTTAFEDEDEADTPSSDATVAWDEDDDEVDVAGLQAAAIAAGTAAPAGDDKKARRELFPDIDEINSTLDSHGGFSEPDEHDDSDDRPGGFGRGFFVVIIVVAFLLALYLVAPQLAQNVPALEPVLSAYAGAIDTLRGLIYGMVRGGGEAN